MKIHAVGGYGLVGRNMTVYEMEKSAVAIDIGLHLDNYIAYQEVEPEKEFIEGAVLEKIGAVPNLEPIRGIVGKVKAIVITHGHLDHIGGVQFLERNFKAPIICTPFTAAILRTLAKDTKTRIRNKIVEVKQGEKHKLNDEVTLEFIAAAHSIPETSIIALHTKEGVYLHATDFKFDDHPGVGAKTDVRRLSQLNGKVKAVVLDTLNADSETKTPSENVAKEMLRDVMLHKELSDKGIIVSTFSSHIARLRTIYSVAYKMKRKIVFIGRSLEKYINAAKGVGMVSFDNAEIIGYSRKVRAKLKAIEKEGKDKYIIVATGHQGEPGSVLDRIAKGELKFKLEANDAVIFSCRVIPVTQNIENREKLEHELRSKNVRLFKDVHVSGHLAAEDHRYFLELIKPEHILPTHSSIDKAQHMVGIAKKIGYQNGSVNILKEGDTAEY